VSGRTSRALVLNVDDNEAGRYGRTRTLQRAGFDVIEAGTGEEALLLVFERVPQIVVLDLMLQDLTGLEVCRRINADPRTQRTPVLHISATYDRARGQSMSLESGGDIFLAEPVEPDELITVVRTLLRLHTTEIGLAESEERMRLATEGAGIATWDIDLRTGAAHWTRQLYLMLGYSPDVPATWEMWRTRLHPDDAGDVVRAMEAARSGALFDREHRVLRADNGAERWLAPYGRVHPDERGAATRFLGVVVDVTERKQVEAARERLFALEHAARAQAERAAQLKDEFLATLSHELRSPMSAILGWLQLMKSGKLGEPDRARALETIERNARLQSQLIEDLLDVSRIITGKLEIEAKPVLLERVIEAAVDSIRLAAAAKDITLVAGCEVTSSVLGDPDRLQQVFVNLLSNAVKFTSRGGRVEVRARCEGRSCRVQVIDNGEGIASELLPHLFERFTQGDGSTTRRHGGLGLGLAIVRHLVEAHGGNVTAESGGPGTGAVFTVTLPVAALREPPAPVAIAPGDAAVTRTRSLEKVRVLVVDDEPAAAELMSEILRGERMEVRVAHDASEAHALLGAWLPDAMVLDIGMPRIDGYTLLGSLRGRLAHERGRIPAIAVTGYAALADRARALAAGFDAHLTKPYGVDELIDALRALVAARGEQRF
jgi:PAS domain S-box-containing protein